MTRAIYRTLPVALLLLVACGPGGSPPQETGPLASGAKLKIENWPAATQGRIKFVFEGNALAQDFNVAADGAVEYSLPKPPDSSLRAVTLGAGPGCTGGFTVSPNTLKQAGPVQIQAFVTATTTPSGSVVAFSRTPALGSNQAGDKSPQLGYFDRDATITGTVTCPATATTPATSTTYNANVRAGWNYLTLNTVTASGNQVTSSTVTASAALPDGTKWYYIATQ